MAIFDNYWGTTLAFAAALGARGVPLHVYGSGAVRWSRYARRRAACPPLEDVGHFLPWLRQRVRSGEIQRVAPTTDLLVWYLAELRSEFSPEVRRTIAPLEQIEAALIKPRFNARCEALGQAVPCTVSPASLEQAVAAARRLGYPLMLKPKSHLVVGSAQRGRLIDNESDLRRVFGQWPVASGHEPLADRYPELRWPMLQRYLPAAQHRVYSVSGYKDADGGIVAAGLSYKQLQWPADVGTSVIQRALEDQRILNMGLSTIDALLGSGIFELELVDNSQALAAIDLNPRAFGFMNLDIARGNDLPWLWFCSTHGALRSQPGSQGRHSAPTEARLLVPYWIGRATRRLPRAMADRSQLDSRETSGALQPAAHASDASDAAGRSDSAHWVSILGCLHDPLPMLLANAQLLRHPRSLLRNLIPNAKRAAPATVGGSPHAATQPGAREARPAE